MVHVERVDDCGVGVTGLPVGYGVPLPKPVMLTHIGHSVAIPPYHPTMVPYPLIKVSRFTLADIARLVRVQADHIGVVGIAGVAIISVMPACP